MKKQPAPKKKKTEPKPELTVEYEGELPNLFFVYENSGRWRAMAGGGTTESLLWAGTFPKAKADELAAATGAEVMPLERAVLEATRSANPVVIAAIAARVAR